MKFVFCEGKDDVAVVKGLVSHLNLDLQVEEYGGKPMPFLPRRLVRIRRRNRIGEPVMHKATIAHAERTNLSVRLFNRRFTRCTLGYSKKLENLKHAFALFVWHFDFCRKHGAHGFTPAFAAGVAPKEPMTIEQLLAETN